MFDFYDTEAAHLSEIYDGAEIFEPYTKAEREEYKRRKSIFHSSAKGKYVIMQKPRFTTVKKLFLVDRKKLKDSGGHTMPTMQCCLKMNLLQKSKQQN